MITSIAPEALRPRVEGDFANDRVKHDIMARLFGDPSPTARIGRFTVVRELGRGGTGVVHAAYDEQLERKVAVKLLHADGQDPGARARLLREAQAMARLSHPHIVSVHEVGTHHGQIYIAMEFVHGLTLGTWLKKQPRSWREVVEVFRQAGSGLAAAHAVGLVHRDFKPANVMVGDDGRVRVLDFGLARADADPDPEAPTRDPADPDADPPTRQHADKARPRDPALTPRELADPIRPLDAALTPRELADKARPLDASLTITGSLVGTPAFMAPEQFRGERADARSDQFALCVALYEALFAARPFAGDTIAELMDSVLAGAVRDPGSTVKLPRGLRAAILRGLARRPEDRHPTMDALLAAIDRATLPRRRPWLAGLALTLGIGGGLGGLALGAGASGHVCEDSSAAELAAVWSPARADAIAAALRAQGPDAGDAWSPARARFAVLADAWQRERVAACSAEQRREQSSALAGLRRACLADQLRALDAALTLLEGPGADLAAHAADVAAGLADPGECSDTRELQRRGPEDPARAAALADLRADLARADALRSAGLHADALAQLDALAARLDADAGPLRAAEQRSRGRLLAALGRDKDALSSLQTAYFTSLAAGDDRLAAAAAIDLIDLTGDGLRDRLAAERWVRHARALLATAASPALQAELARAEAQLAARPDAPTAPAS